MRQKERVGHGAGPGGPRRGAFSVWDPREEPSQATLEVVLLGDFFSSSFFFFFFFSKLF